MTPYWGCSSHDPEVECARYVVDPAGTRVGCHLDDLGDPKTTDYFFLVNGTSNRTAVRFLDFTPFRAKLMGERTGRLPCPPNTHPETRDPHVRSGETRTRQPFCARGTEQTNKLCLQPLKSGDGGVQIKLATAR